MIRIAQQNDLHEILSLLRMQVKDCLYMYIDISKYGVKTDYLDVWIDCTDNNAIQTILMRYHTGFSIFTLADDWLNSEILELINTIKPKSITSTKKNIEQLMLNYNDTYNCEFGYVFKFHKYYPLDMDVCIEHASINDATEIAELVCKDESIGAYYNIADLKNQYIDRMKSKMGRNLIVRENGKIIGHIASYAEYDGLATTSGLIVDEIHRNGFLGSYLEKKLVEELMAEGFEVYTFVTKRLRYKLLLSMGNECVGEYGKMTFAE